MSTTNVTNRIVLDNFSPGIFSDYHASGAIAANSSQANTAGNGAATVQNTWGCCADPHGSLVPLPALTSGRESAVYPSGTHLANLPNVYLLDALLVPDIANTASGPLRPPEVVTLQMFGMPSGVDFAVYPLVRRWSQWKATPDTRDISFTKQVVPSTHARILSGNLAPIRGTDTEANITDPAQIKKGYAWVARIARLTENPGVPTQFTTGTIGATDAGYTDYDTWTGGTSYPTRLRGGLYGFFPNFAASTPISPGHFDGSAIPFHFREPLMIVSHQDRIVVAQTISTVYDQSGADIQYAYRDALAASAPFRPQVWGGNLEAVAENISGVGTIASLSADELLVVKHTGGGFLVRGSVVAPTVTKLPFIESTYGVVSSPVATPMGLVYGTRNGVFVWEGGESSRSISPQIEGFFWNHAPNVQYEGHRGRFGYWHPWVLAPNNYAFDTRSQSWWRLDNPTTHQPYNVYQVSDNGTLYAFPYQISGDANGNIVWNQATPDFLASDWSWQSQPLVESRDQAYKVRDIQLLATATAPGSAVTITISGYTNTGAFVSLPAVVFTLADVADRPQMVMRDVANQNLALTYIQVRIQGTATALSPAPKVHSVSIGTLDVAPVRKS